MYNQRFSVLPFNRHFLDKFLALARSHDIPVYWATMPVLPVVVECREKVNFNPDYFGFLDDLHDRHGVRILQKEFTVLDEEYFQDYSHLNEAGARLFTEQLVRRFEENGGAGEAEVSGASAR